MQMLPCDDSNDVAYSSEQQKVELMKLSFISIFLILFPLYGFAQNVCDDGSYRFSSVSENGDIDSSLFMALRRNNSHLHQIIGPIPRDIEGVYIPDGSWVITIYTQSEALMNFSIINSRNENFRRDVLVAFLGEQTVYTRYEILGINLNDGYVRQYDFIQMSTSPPEQILFTIGFRKIPEHFAWLKNQAGEEYETWSAQFDVLQAAIFASTGTWSLQPCNGE